MNRLIPFLFVFSCVNLWGQGTAQISGTVRDQSGAVLPGVEITATQAETGVARATVTNEDRILRPAKSDDRSV